MSRRIKEDVFAQNGVRELTGRLKEWNRELEEARCRLAVATRDLDLAQANLDAAESDVHVATTMAGADGRLVAAARCALESRRAVAQEVAQRAIFEAKDAERGVIIRGKNLREAMASVAKNTVGTSMAVPMAVATIMTGAAAEPSLAPSKKERVTDRVRRAFAFAELLVPQRIAAEELGDAMEQITSFARGRRPHWQIYLKVATTIFWVLWHAIRDVGRAPVRKKR